MATCINAIPRNDADQLKGLFHTFRVAMHTTAAHHTSPTVNRWLHFPSFASLVLELPKLSFLRMWACTNVGVTIWPVAGLHLKYHDLPPLQPSIPAILISRLLFIPSTPLTFLNCPLFSTLCDPRPFIHIYCRTHNTKKHSKAH